MNGLLIVGAGGHGKVIADTAYMIGRWEKLAFIDDRYPSLNTVLNWPVLGKFNQISDQLGSYTDVIVAVGDNYLRVELLRRFAEIGFSLPNIVHPSAFVSKYASIEAGSVAFAQSAVNAGTRVGFGSIINTGATVDHDCILGEGVHISPGVHLAGEVSIGSYSWLGVGSSIIQQISIGENVIVGAGAVIIKDVESNVKVIGVPGRVVKINDKIR